VKRTDFLNALCATGIGTAGVAGATTLPRGIAGVSIPDTNAAREATAIAQTSIPPEIYNHSLRTYLFAELIAQTRGTEHDPELVYVASILHDTGLSTRYMSADQRFEVDGANLSREILKRHGVTGQRADLVWDAIALHDSGGIARWKQPEVSLVNAGVSADFGAYLSQLQREDIVAVLREAPRSGFIDAFLDAVAAVAARKPEATGNCFVTDVGYRKVPGFHLTNFCDAVKDDPFKAYGS
jgi:HD domain